MRSSRSSIPKGSLTSLMLARSTSGRVVGIGAVLATGVLAAWFITTSHRKSRTTDPESEEPAALASSEVVRPNAAPVAVSHQVPPWAATRENSPSVPAGQIPAWVARPPAPDLAMHLPAAPVAPPDPQATTPPMDNPGGVNGDRSPRPEATGSR